MLKQVFMVGVLALALGCGKSSDGGQNEKHESFPLITVDDPVPASAGTFDVNITYVNFSDEQKAKYEAAVRIVKRVVASEEFKEMVLTHTHGGEETYVDSGGRSNSDIYQNILSGNETLRPERNNRMDVEVELYDEASSTVGYTYPSSRRIWINTKYFDAYTPANVAGNLFHEWLHKLGYVHAVSYSPGRDDSVPYAIGRMVSALGKNRGD